MGSIPEYDADSPPRSWRFGTGKDADGNTIRGEYVATESGFSRYSDEPVPILVLDNVDGERRAVWCNDTALRNKVRDELARRGADDFVPGERVVIARSDEKKQSAAGNSYWYYRVVWPDAPRRTAADVFGVQSIPTTYGSVTETNHPVDTDTDDDIPF
jgi:hypothetical protein